MNLDSWRVITYRARRTLAHRFRSYLAITLVLGALGGLALGSIAAARRTQSAYPQFLESTNPSTLQVTVWEYTTSTGAVPLRQQDAMAGELSRLRNVRHVERFVYPLTAPINAKGQLERDAAISPVASVAGDFFNEDRPAVVAGRMPNPDSPGEFATTPLAARSQGWHVGESINWAVFRPSQFSASGATPEHPARIVRERLVGLVEFNTSVLQDQADAKTSLALFTPAFAGRMRSEAGVQTSRSSCEGAGRSPQPRNRSSNSFRRAPSMSSRSPPMRSPRSNVRSVLSQSRSPPSEVSSRSRRWRSRRWRLRD